MEYNIQNQLFIHHKPLIFSEDGNFSIPLIKANETIIVFIESESGIIMIQGLRREYFFQNDNPFKLNPKVCSCIMYHFQSIVAGICFGINAKYRLGARSPKH